MQADHLAVVRIALARSKGQPIGLVERVSHLRASGSGAPRRLPRVWDGRARFLLDAPVLNADRALVRFGAGPTMTDNGLFRRRADPHDGRRVFIELAPETSLALRRYFAEVCPQAVV